MTFTDVNVATLVSWFITGLVMMFSGSYFMSDWKFRRYYSFLQLKAGGLFNFPKNGFGLMWLLIAASQIAAMVLWTMNYQFCDNTYYVAVVALALAEFVFISMWAPLFVRMNRPGAAAFTTFLALAAGGIAVGFMAGTVVRNNAGCTFSADGSKLPGILACIFWGWPLLWLLVAFLMTLRVARSDRCHLYYKHFVHHHLKKWIKEEKAHVNYDDAEHRRYHKSGGHPRHGEYKNQHHRRRHSVDYAYGGPDAEIGQPLVPNRVKSANLKPQ